MNDIYEDIDTLKDHIKDLILERNRLEIQVKKQQEVINNIKKTFDDGSFKDECDCLIIEKYVKSYLKKE